MPKHINYKLTKYNFNFELEDIKVNNIKTDTRKIKKGDIIGQGIVKKYYLTDNDDLAQSKDKARKRTGGFGSTSERAQ